MTQREKLKDLLINFCNHRQNRTFQLDELNSTYGDYDAIGIGGKTPRATVRRLLQELRNENFLTFLDNSGYYTLRGIDFLNSELEELNGIIIPNEQPEKKEYLVETYIRNTSWAREARSIFGRFCLCNSCQNTFTKDNGEPYIEVHHILPLCKGGEDTMLNLSVLCAHHHRMAHFACHEQKMKIRKYLLKEVQCRI